MDDWGRALGDEGFDLAEDEEPICVGESEIRKRWVKTTSGQPLTPTL